MSEAADIDRTAPGPAGGPTVFVSYARADQPRVERLVAALAQAGCGVWWDALIEAGAAFAQSIEAALDRADVIVVAWSAASVASDWVRDEAAHGRDRGRFVPISLDGTPPPLGFRQYQVIDFARWDGAADAAEMRRLLAAIRADAARRSRARTTPAPALAVRRGWPRRGVMAGAGALGLAAVAGGLAWHRRAGAAAGNSIGVLPFANLSGDAGQDWFSDGLSEELRARLGQAGQFRVAAQVSSNQFRNHATDAVTAAARLGVAYLLDGSVRRAGNALRITAELIEAQSGLSKWSQDYDSQLTDIFAVQGDIAAMVVQAIAGQISPAAQAMVRNAGTNNVDAYDAFLKGRASYEADIDEGSDRKAVALFEAAIAADPHYAEAWAARASALLDIGANYSKAGEVRDVYAAALASAQRAVALAPRLAVAQLAMADALFTGQVDARAARPWYDRARALGGHDADILELFAFFASKTGRNADALDAIERAIVLDPLNPLMLRAKGRFLYAARRWDAALQALREALGMSAQLSGAHAYIGNVLMMQGQAEAARAAYALEPRGDLRLTGLAIALARLGRQGEAQATFAQLVSKYGDFVLYQQAQVHAQWGQADLAIAALQRARVALDSGLTLMGSDPLLDSLRGDPRFVGLLAALGLKPG